jgi:hypothetical protein
MKILHSSKCTNVAFWDASRMEMFSMRASRHLLLSVSRTNVPRNNMWGLLFSLSASGAAGRPPCVWIAGRSCMWFFNSIETYYFRHGPRKAEHFSAETAFAMGCFAMPCRERSETPKTHCSRVARWEALGPSSARTSKVFDNANGVQRDGNNLEIIVVQPLYVDLGAVDRGNYLPELSRS